MSKHEKEDPKDRYVKNGYERSEPPPEDPGGKHGKPDPEDEGDKDPKK